MSAARFSAEGLRQLGLELGPNDLVRGATWVRASGAIEVPLTDVDLYIAEACEIRTILILADPDGGDCEIDIWRAPFSSFPPDSGDSIFATNPPSITNADTYSDSTLTGVSVNNSAGDVLRFHLTSSNTFERISVFLVLRKL